MYYIIGIGSNLGQRRLLLSRAVRLIANQFGNFEVSHVVETPAHGFQSTHKFLNCVMMVQADIQPLEMLHQLQKIEKQISKNQHRNPDGSYRDREIDIDIIAADDIIIDTPELQLPHPRMAQRLFVLQPMAEIAGAWKHPITGLSAMEMLENLIIDTPENPQ